MSMSPRFFYYSFVTLPIKSIAPVLVSVIMKAKGRLRKKSMGVGAGPAEFDIPPMVTAAASVPFHPLLNMYVAQASSDTVGLMKYRRNRPMN